MNGLNLLGAEDPVAAHNKQVQDALKTVQSAQARTKALVAVSAVTIPVGVLGTAALLYWYFTRKKR